MEVLFGVIIGKRLAYQSSVEEKAQSVAKKSKGTFVRLYAFEGDITTFDLKNKTEETMDEFFNRLVAINIHLMEQVQELRFEKSGLILDRTTLERQVNESISKIEINTSH